MNLKEKAEEAEKEVVVVSEGVFAKVVAFFVADWIKTVADFDSCKAKTVSFFKMLKEAFKVHIN